MVITMPSYFLGATTSVETNGVRFLGPPVHADDPPDSGLDFQKLIMWAGVALLIYFLFQAIMDSKHA